MPTFWPGVTLWTTRTSTLSLFSVAYSSICRQSAAWCGQYEKGDRLWASWYSWSVSANCPFDHRWPCLPRELYLRENVGVQGEAWAPIRKRGHSRAYDRVPRAFCDCIGRILPCMRWSVVPVSLAFPFVNKFVTDKWLKPLNDSMVISDPDLLPSVL